MQLKLVLCLLIVSALMLTVDAKRRRWKKWKKHISTAKEWFKRIFLDEEMQNMKLLREQNKDAYDLLLKIAADQFDDNYSAKEYAKALDELIMEDQH